MRYVLWFVSFAVVTALVLASGCATTSFGNQQAGNFGSTSDQQAAINWFIGTYGDPRGPGTPAFIEPLVTTNVVNDMPVDKVTAFAKTTDKIYFWVFYEHFTVGDTITMNMVYTTNGNTVLTSSQPTAGEYGAATGSVSAPSGGWPVGNYQITFSGKGATKTVAFTVVDGATVTVPLPYTGAPGVKAGQSIPVVTTTTVLSQAMQSNSDDAVNEANDVLSRGTLRKAANVSATIPATTGVTVKSVKVYVFKDGSAVVNMSYIPGSGVQNPQDLLTIEQTAFGAMTGPVVIKESEAGPFTETLGSGSGVIVIPVDRNEFSTRTKIINPTKKVAAATAGSPDIKYSSFGVSSYPSITTNTTGTLYTTLRSDYPQKILYILRYFDKSRAVLDNTAIIPKTTHFVPAVSNGNVFPINFIWNEQSSMLVGEPIPGAEIYVELEPDDEPIIAMGAGGQGVPGGGKQ